MWYWHLVLRSRHLVAQCDDHPMLVLFQILSQLHTLVLDNSYSFRVTLFVSPRLSSIGYELLMFFVYNAFDCILCLLVVQLTILLSPPIVGHSIDLPFEFHSIDLLFLNHLIDLLLCDHSIVSPPGIIQLLPPTCPLLLGL